MVHGIHRETELFKRYHSNDWLGALLAEHDDCRLCPRAQADVDPRHWVADLASISQDERPFVRSEERREGKRVDHGGRRNIKKENNKTHCSACNRADTNTITLMTVCRGSRSTNPTNDRLWKR